MTETVEFERVNYEAFGEEGSIWKAEFEGVEGYGRTIANALQDLSHNMRVEND